MYVYSDIAKLFLLSNNKLPIISVFKLQKRFLKILSFVLYFTLFLYVKIKKKHVRTIIIKISSETVKENFIQDDVVTCCFYICHRLLLASIYITNHVSKFIILTLKNINL